MNKKKGVFSKGLIVFIIFMILGYAVADFYMQYSLGVQFNDTFTTCWFAFWAVELVDLVLVRLGKLRHPQDTLGVTPEVEDTTEEYMEEGDRGE